MKKIAIWLLLMCTSLFLSGCYFDYMLTEPEETSSVINFTDELTETVTEAIAETETESESVSQTEVQTQEFETLEDETIPDSVEKDGAYTSPEDVAEYIHTFGTLPANFITKKEAQNLGWDNSKGNLWDVTDGKSIGGDYFGNYEGLLPEGNYHECDVNYQGGYRGAERIVYSDTGEIYYTNDHYQTFTQLY